MPSFLGYPDNLRSIPLAPKAAKRLHRLLSDITTRKMMIKFVNYVHIPSSLLQESLDILPAHMLPPRPPYCAVLPPPK